MIGSDKAAITESAMSATSLEDDSASQGRYSDKSPTGTATTRIPRWIASRGTNGDASLSLVNNTRLDLRIAVLTELGDIWSNTDVSIVKPRERNSATTD